MKVDVFSLNGDELVFYPSVPNRTIIRGIGYPVEFLGTIDLPIENPKKVVTREAYRFPDAEPTKVDRELYVRIARFQYPDNAKNLKCTYEIEE